MIGTYGERIRSAREARGWTRERLARETGLHAKTIKRLEEEESGPRDSTWELLKYVLTEI